MPESASWIAVAFAAIAMIRSELSAMTARRGERDKLEVAAQSARDKLEFDAKLVSLQSDHAQCQSATASMQADLAACREQHRVAESDRSELRDRLAAVEVQLKAPVK